ncbi:MULTISPECIES: hypothetical protein [unclassified Bradyrhizobium]|uniref:hypothetical protein n=1 Tax=Bradyrhizobium sp. USDA 4541 TaxID=2817704 RepID=UPI0020A4286A|nr:hypothetical protein [Bradyrhizobium sp. USDA 4541]MCP1852107.1 hypothetical protein [Bradyrhizobium sp. USDA 4541]
MKSPLTYDQTLDMAVAKYGNANNYRGFPHLTGARVATSTFVPGTTVDTPDGGFGTGPGDGSPGDGGGSPGGYETQAVEFLAGSD